MPEVKWVDSQLNLQNLTDLCTCCPHIPVMPLDQIEEWLGSWKGQTHELNVIVKLLAQVQAMKEAT